MRYTKTVTLQGSDLTALHTGALKLQCGQWVHIAPLSEGQKPSRFVGVTKGGTIVMAHPDGGMATGKVRKGLWDRKRDQLKRMG